MTNKDNRELGSTIQKTSAIIDEFKNLGYMRPNRFEMTINSPLSLPRVERQIQFHIKDIGLPDRTLRSVMNGNQYGPPMEIVQGQTYGALSATFYLSSDMSERTYFEDWQKTTFNTNTYDLNYYKEYVGSIEIYTLNEQDERKYGVLIHEVFPDTINPIQLSQDASTAVGTFQVGFKYRKFSTIGKEPKFNTLAYGAGS